MAASRVTVTQAIECFESIQNYLSKDLSHLLPQLNAFKTVFIEQRIIEKQKSIQTSILSLIAGKWIFKFKNFYINRFKIYIKNTLF